METPHPERNVKNTQIRSLEKIHIGWFCQTSEASRVKVSQQMMAWSSAAAGPLSFFQIESQHKNMEILEHFMFPFADRIYWYSDLFQLFQQDLALANIAKGIYAYF